MYLFLKLLFSCGPQGSYNVYFSGFTVFVETHCVCVLVRAKTATCTHTSFPFSDLPQYVPRSETIDFKGLSLVSATFKKPKG